MELGASLGRYAEDILTKGEMLNGEILVLHLLQGSKGLSRQCRNARRLVRRAFAAGSVSGSRNRLEAQYTRIVNATFDEAPDKLRHHRWLHWR